MSEEQQQQQEQQQAPPDDGWDANLEADLISAALAEWEAAEPPAEGEAAEPVEGVPEGQTAEEASAQEDAAEQQEPAEASEEKPAEETPPEPDLKTQLREELMAEVRQAQRRSLDAIAKEDARLRDQRGQIKEQQRELADLARAKQAIADGNYMEALQIVGVNNTEAWTKLTNQALGREQKADPAIEHVKRLEAELHAMRKETLQREEQQRRQMALDNQLGKIQAHIVQDPERYELLMQESHAVDMVFETAARHYQETQEVLSVDKAADLVEQQLFDAYKSRLGAKKFQALQRQEPTPQQPAVQRAPAEQPQQDAEDGPRTLSNTNSAGVSSRGSVDIYDEEELLRRAEQEFARALG